MGVIDLFEVVQIEDNHREGMLITLGSSDLILQAVAGVAAVMQAGQRIQDGYLVDLFSKVSTLPTEKAWAVTCRRMRLICTCW